MLTTFGIPLDSMIFNLAEHIFICLDANKYVFLPFELTVKRKKLKKLNNRMAYVLQINLRNSLYKVRNDLIRTSVAITTNANARVKADNQSNRLFAYRILADGARVRVLIDLVTHRLNLDVVIGSFILYKYLYSLQINRVY